MYAVPEGQQGAARSIWLDRLVLSTSLADDRPYGAGGLFIRGPVDDILLTNLVFSTRAVLQTELDQAVALATSDLGSLRLESVSVHFVNALIAMALTCMSAFVGCSCYPDCYGLLFRNCTGQFFTVRYDSPAPVPPGLQQDVGPVSSPNQFSCALMVQYSAACTRMIAGLTSPVVVSSSVRTSSLPTNALR